MKRVLGIGAAVAATLTFVTPAAAGAAAPAAPDGYAGERYVALGDSFTSGPLIPDQYGQPPGCLRSTRNYPALVASSLGAKLTDVSCGGARTKDMTAAQTTVLGVNPPQLDSLTRDTSLVTLGIGGNDVGFAEIVVTCAVGSLVDPKGAPCAKHYGDSLDKRVDETAPKVAAVLRQIREKAPNARVLVVGYLRLLPERPGCWPRVPIAEGDVPYLDGMERRLNQVLKDQATAHGAGFVDAYGGGLGHDMCAPADQRWVEGILPGNPAAPVHPNAAGMREVAKRVQNVLSAVRTDA